ncbi:hypothetical protein R3P38DRAFT_2786587 [Favolaschia claudopus]|uniref:Uncharacterized protein n=1 Tax=Favolaschia claudopus TaxID=2862362 RepID=A0AAW0AQK1_9AGAR
MGVNKPFTIMQSAAAEPLLIAIAIHKDFECGEGHILFFQGDATKDNTGRGIVRRDGGVNIQGHGSIQLWKAGAATERHWKDAWVTSSMLVLYPVLARGSALLGPGSASTPLQRRIDLTGVHCSLPLYVTDTAPADRWNYDILAVEEEAELRRIVQVVITDEKGWGCEDPGTWLNTLVEGRRRFESLRITLSSRR